MRKDSFSLILSSILLFISTFSFAQQGTDSRFFYGGNLGLMFGQHTLVDISPLVGYKVTEKFHVGTGLTYTYYKYSEAGTYNNGIITNSFEYSTHVYGGRLFARYYLLPNIFVHTEDELISFEIPHFSPFPNEVIFTRQWLNSVLVGAGYAHAFNVDGPHLSLMFLWRLNTEFEDYYPYPNPIIRAGLGFGF